MTTLTDLITTHGVEVHDHLDRDDIIPVSSGMQRQGDVLIIPTPGVKAQTPVPASGTAVVRGEAGGNTHAIVTDSPGVRCDTKAASATNLTLATLTIPEGETAYLAHPEHGYTGIGPGTYILSRQREQADELRMVAD